MTEQLADIVYRVISNPKNSIFHKSNRGHLLAVISLGALVGWECIARTFTDYWDPVKQVQTINQMCKHGDLSLNSNWVYFWKPNVPSRHDKETGRTFYDSPDGEFYRSDTNGKFYYIPKPQA